MRFWKRSLIFLLAVCFLAGMASTAFAADKTNPIIFPGQPMDYQAYPDTIINLLLLGIDLGTDGYWGSGLKDDLLDCHTDAVMVVAMNLTKNRIDIISIPRDTLTIVPGVRGLYKLNGAINCADTLAEGLQRTQAAVERILGDIKIDGCFAVDMGAMIVLGDAMGGIDYTVDMYYQGDSGTMYEKGFQHLDGQGIMDYVRARKNATFEGTDLGRTRRQREMMTAVIGKLMSDSKSALQVISALADPQTGVYTNVTGMQAVGLLSAVPLLLQSGEDTMASYTLEGGYRRAMEWNFTFTNEKTRGEIIKAVYGIDAKPLRYVSRRHASFYTGSGFYSMHVINICTDLIADIRLRRLPMTDTQQEVWEQLNLAYEKAVEDFQLACDTLEDSDITRMKYSRVTMRNLAMAFTEDIGYDIELPWEYSPAEWYKDAYINDFQLDWR